MLSTNSNQSPGSSPENLNLLEKIAERIDAHLSPPCLFTEAEKTELKTLTKHATAEELCRMLGHLGNLLDVHSDSETHRLLVDQLRAVLLKERSVELLIAAGSWADHCLRSYPQVRSAEDMRNDATWDFAIKVLLSAASGVAEASGKPSPLMTQQLCSLLNLRTQINIGTSYYAETQERLINKADAARKFLAELRSVHQKSAKIIAIDELIKKSEKMPVSVCEALLSYLSERLLNSQRESSNIDLAAFGILLSRCEARVIELWTSKLIITLFGQIQQISNPWDKFRRGYFYKLANNSIENNPLMINQIKLLGVMAATAKGTHGFLSTARLIRGLRYTKEQSRDATLGAISVFFSAAVQAPNSKQTWLHEVAKGSAVNSQDLINLAESYALFAAAKEKSLAAHLPRMLSRLKRVLLPKVQKTEPVPEQNQIEVSPTRIDPEKLPACFPPNYRKISAAELYAQSGQLAASAGIVTVEHIKGQVCPEWKKFVFRQIDALQESKTLADQLTALHWYFYFETQACDYPVAERDKKHALPYRVYHQIVPLDFMLNYLANFLEHAGSPELIVSAVNQVGTSLERKARSCDFNREDLQEYGRSFARFALRLIPLCPDSTDFRVIRRVKQHPFFCADLIVDGTQPEHRAQVLEGLKIFSR